MARDPYQVLGVPRGAGADDIRKAFRKLAKKHHPDANPGDSAAEERFKQVSAAFDILGDAEKRRKFDAGEIDADGRETFRGFGGGPGQGGPSGGFEGADFSDIFGEMFGRRAGRGGPRGGAGPGPGAGFSAKGPDVRARLEIDLEEAILGGKKRISFQDGRTLDVTIPAGAADGQTLRLRGHGEPGRGGKGDALIELAIKPHAVFRREGEQLVMDLPVSVPDAVLGGRVQAPTPDGPVTLTVPRGANSGQSLRLKGKGLSDARGVRGDLIARIQVMLPEGPDAKLEAFAARWREERPYAPRRR
ncbi:DnaJ C-terminal domain-containing protein [Phenylobacterium parvum]|uniref:Molecular chaperone DnaJ n=1 Tax=Phenylobacterium parvum TaxID=2201350 RepID=A0A2Z3HU91_9CAUL|nr:J domain-containing protein [Phenylobacterium parvum]AWM76900.1 molecular chaperone DnaJ [Phenylobacterium parvum]